MLTKQDLVNDLIAEIQGLNQVGNILRDGKGTDDDFKEIKRRCRDITTYVIQIETISQFEQEGEKWQENEKKKYKKK